MRRLASLLPLLIAACSGSSSPGAPTDASRTTTDGAAGRGSDAGGSLDGTSSGSGSGSNPGSGTDPADDGTFTVTTQVVSIPGTGSDVVPATVYQPGGGTAPYPLVVVSPGFQLARTQYASLAHHLATWGFVVVLTDYANQSPFNSDHQTEANDVGKVIDWALAQTALAVDSTRIATAGHSLGGDVSILAAADDPRVKAVVGWDPVDGTTPSVTPEHMAHFTAALAVIGETTDGGSGATACAPTAEDYAAFYAGAPAGTPAMSMTVANAYHMDWVDDPTCLVCSFCAAAASPADPATVHAITRRVDVAWLRLHLLGDAAMSVWLTAPAGTTVQTK